MFTTIVCISKKSTENKANLALPRDVKKLKGLQLQGALPPDPVTRGSVPGPQWGSPTVGPDLRYSSRSARSSWNPLSQIVRLCRCVPQTPCWGFAPGSHWGTSVAQTPLSWYPPHWFVSQLPLCTSDRHHYFWRS